MNTASQNTPTPSSKTLIIGIGNEFRGDDGVGLFVAAEMRKLVGDKADVLGVSSEGTELISLWSGRERVILIDATCSGSRVGQIFKFQLPSDKIPKAIFPKYSTHAMGLVDALELSGVLGKLPERVVVFGIEGGSFHLMDHLSPEVRQATAEVIHDIAKEVGWGREDRKVE